MKNTKNMGNKYIWSAYRILKQEIANYSAFEIDERYFQLRRDLEICKQFLMDTENIDITDERFND